MLAYSCCCIPCFVLIVVWEFQKRIQILFKSLFENAFGRFEKEKEKELGINLSSVSARRPSLTFPPCWPVAFFPTAASHGGPSPARHGPTGGCPSRRASPLLVSLPPGPTCRRRHLPLARNRDGHSMLPWSPTLLRASLSLPSTSVSPS
jgi:hypothetical protein